MGVSKGQHPLVSIQPSLASSPAWRFLQDLAALDLPESTATIFVSDPPGGDSSLWGEVAPVARLACGTYLPLVKQSSCSFDVELHLPGARVSGSAAYPLRMKVEGAKGDSARPGPARVPCSVFLLAHMPVVVQSEEGETLTYHRFCVLNDTGVSVMETESLQDGTWITKTSVAEETDLRLRCSVGAAQPSARGVPRPPAPPDLPEGALDHLQVWIIALEGARDSNVERLEEAFKQACAPLFPGASSPGLPVRKFKAWDTRELSAGTVRAFCHEAVLNRQIFSRETVLLKGAGSSDTHTETVHKRASKVLGCALSHSDLWYQLAVGRDEGPWVILEDDAVLNESRPIVAVLKSALATFAGGSWDILLLGAVSPHDVEWDYLSPCTMGPVKDFIGFWGYAISKQGALKALSHIWGSEKERLGLRGDIDVECAGAAKRGRLRVLACMPQLVFHPQCGLDPSLVHAQSARRHVCRPARYQYRTIQVDTDFEFDSTRIGLDAGDGAINIRLVRQVAARVAAFRRAAEGPSGEESGPGRPESAAEEWVVVHARVAKRAEPSTGAKAVGMAVVGTRVRGLLRDLDGVEWLELQEHGCSQSPSAWMLVHGQSIGLGQLLERAPPVE